MLETVKQIIIDSQEQTLQTGVPRRLEIQAVPNKATVVIGVRRCGKSTFLFQLMERLLRQGVPRENLLYVNFFDDRLHGLRQQGPAAVLDAYFALYPEKKNTELVYCFFDEIQAVPGWEPFVDRAMRTERCQVFLSGSSARMLSREIAPQMRGRALSWELFPFSFQEFLDSQGLDSAAPRSTKKRHTLRKAFDEYRQTGGFPEVVGLDRRLRIKIHQEYLRAVLFRDLVERHDVSHPRAVSDLAHRLLESTASLYSINSLTGYLKSLAHRAPKAAVSGYLAWFEDAYFLFSVRLFDASLSRSNANPKKIYCADHALVPSVASGVLVNSGHLLENLVFIALRRVSPEIHYYRTRSGLEVDFTLRPEAGPRRLVQVCESLAEPRTRKREIDARGQAMAELDLASGTIVTLDQEERIETASGAIEVVPAWRFLLDAT